MDRFAFLGFSFFVFYVIASLMAKEVFTSTSFEAKLAVSLALTVITGFATKKG